MTSSKGQGHRHAQFDWKYVINGDRLLLPSEMKSYICFRLTYIDLTVIHSKGRGHDHAHFDWEYLINGVILIKCYHNHQIAGATSSCI